MSRVAGESGSLEKKKQSPLPYQEPTPPCSPPSAHLRAGLGHPLALPGPRGLPGDGSAVTTGLVTAHAPLSKACRCSQLPLAMALPPAGTQQGHNWDTAGTGSGRSRGPRAHPWEWLWGRGGAPGPQHAPAALLGSRVKQSGCKKLPTARGHSPPAGTVPGTGVRSAAGVLAAARPSTQPVGPARHGRCLVLARSFLFHTLLAPR